MNEESVKSAENILTGELAGSFKILKEQLMNLKTKIVAIDNYYEYDLEPIEQDINMRNFKNFKTKCQAFHIYTNKKTQIQSVIVEVPAVIYKYIKENNNRIFVGHQRKKYMTC